jgi:hypothetical protein
MKLWGLFSFSGLLILKLISSGLVGFVPNEYTPSGGTTNAQSALVALGELAMDPFRLSRAGMGRITTDVYPGVRYPVQLSGEAALFSRRIPCEEALSNSCLGTRGILFPMPPGGFYWKRLNGLYTFSAYSHAVESDFMGNLAPIPGIKGLEAKEDFLFGVSGVGMQGSGTIWRLDDQRVLRPINLRYISGHWVLNGRDVVIEDKWYYADDQSPVARDLIRKIRLTDARFAILPEIQLTPYYSVAAPPEFDTGTQIFVPSLTNYGGLFEVQDRGGAFGPDSQRFDVYVGKKIDHALDWLAQGEARSNLVVYTLIPKSWQ